MADTPFLRINGGDNVAVALDKAPKGSSIEAGGVDVTLLDDIERGHKVALSDIAKGDKVVKYGMPIGYALKDIRQGEHVHTHNIKTLLSGELEYIYEPHCAELAAYGKDKTFMGFERSDGNVGIRNDIWIIPTVGCVNKLAENLAMAGRSVMPMGSVHRMLAFTHPYGCSQLGDDHELTATILANLVKHPNAGGVLVVALGCENNTLESFKERLGEIDEKRIKFLKAQDDGDEYERGIELLQQLADQACGQRRKEFPVSKLKVGLKCGASDGFSGITANPLIGRFSDMIAAAGGTTVLTEVPEMFGAETLLMNRCKDKATFEKCVKMINGFKDYFIRHGQVVYENPSPGNKAGGITTLEDKSLGCTQKGGTSKVVDVLGYGDMLKEPGLNLLTGPGNDMVATTVLAAAGAHMVLFSTGRGTPFGGPVPTVKISTNSQLAADKPTWIDFDAGKLLSGVSMDELAEDFFDYILSVASGRNETMNEKYNYMEIAIFKDGVTL